MTASARRPASPGRTGPVSEAVAQQVLAMIDRGEVRIGGRLPPERVLAAQLRVSRTAVRTALSQLAADGRVRREVGRGGGTFATEPNPNWPGAVLPFQRPTTRRKLQRRPGTAVSVPALMREQGFGVGTRIISAGIEEAEDEAALRLALAPHEAVVAVRRIRLADGEPLSWEQAFFPLSRFPDLLERSLGGSLYELLQDTYGVRVDQACERIEVTLATKEESCLLAVAMGQPLLSVTRWATDTDGIPVEFSSDVFRADRTQLFVDSTRGRDESRIASVRPDVATE